MYYTYIFMIEYLTPMKLTGLTESFYINFTSTLRLCPW